MKIMFQTLNITQTLLFIEKSNTIFDKFAKKSYIVETNQMKKIVKIVNRNIKDSIVNKLFNIFQ